MRNYKIKITLSYDGSKFLGSQSQSQTDNTVSDQLEISLKRLNINTKILFSGRTDKGVHALNQVASCQIPIFWNNLKKLQQELNKSLSPSIYIKKIVLINNDFNPRFDAKRRIYRYIISTNEFNPFFSSYVTFVKNINYEIIKDAIKIFEGRHNFEYFKKNGSDVINFEREIFKTLFYKYKDFYIFYFEANSFLRSQIRMMVDFLLKISDAKLTIDDLKSQLSKQKVINSTLAKPNGLYLAKIKY